MDEQDLFFHFQGVGDGGGRGWKSVAQNIILSYLSFILVSQLIFVWVHRVAFINGSYIQHLKSLFSFQNYLHCHIQWLHAFSQDDPCCSNYCFDRQCEASHSRVCLYDMRNTQGGSECVELARRHQVPEVPPGVPLVTSLSTAEPGSAEIPNKPAPATSSCSDISWGCLQNCRMNTVMLQPQTHLAFVKICFGVLLLYTTIERDRSSQSLELFSISALSEV